jgi:chromosomal replication initiation ATPase DnaA
VPDYARQLALDLGLTPQFGRDNFLVSRSNETALRIIEAWPDWPAQTLLLIGPPGSGKSHLAAIFASRAQAACIAGSGLAHADLVALMAAAALVVEDVDRIGAEDEASLFHLFNLAHETKIFLLMTARGMPETWGLQTPDLLSRLRLCPRVEIEAPDEALFEAVIVKLFFDRQLVVDAAAVSLIALNIDRSLDAARNFVELVDREALARGVPITKSLVRDLLPAISSEDHDS